MAIEDETKTAAYLRQGLSESGFTVEVCANGDEDLDQALTTENGLIIQDVMLPKRDGWSILGALRQAGNRLEAGVTLIRDI